MSLHGKLRDTLRTGGGISLRRLEESDLEYLYKWENDPAVWPFGDCGAVPFAAAATAATSATAEELPDGGTTCRRDAGQGTGLAPERFSREDIRAFIERQRRDMGETGQVRFMICRSLPDGTGGTDGDGGVYGTDSGTPVGFIDLFDIDETSASAGVGILVCEECHRRRGYGGEALRLVKEYARRELRLCELWCDIAPDNRASLALFTAAGFRTVGRAPDGTEHLAFPTDDGPEA